MRIDSIKIKLLMAEQGLTQSGLSERCGIARQSISALLTRGTCAIVNVGKIAKALGVDARELVKEE